MRSRGEDLPLPRSYTFTFSEGERAVFKRRERPRPSLWAEKSVVFPESAAIPGPYRRRKSPHIVWLMDTWAEPWVVHLIVCLPPQSGKTLFMVITKFYTVDFWPGPIMTAYADEATIKRMSGEYILEILDASPRLKRFKSRNPDDTAHKLIRFKNGARWYFSNANNPKDLASVPIRYADADERAKWPKFSGSDAATRDSSPWRLLFQRTRSYRYTKKLTSVSSVRVEDDDQWTALKEDAQQLYVYLVECPRCGTRQRMVWGRFRLADGREFSQVAHTEILDQELGRYQCANEGCGALWDDTDRDQAALRTMHDGWVPVERKYVLDPDHWDDPFPQPPEAPIEHPAVPGCHAASWISPFVSLSEVVAEFLRAHRETDPVQRKALLMAWTNNHPNKPWRELAKASLDTSAFDRLKDDRPAGRVPPWALLLVLTADVQQAGVYFELRAWDAQKRSALVRYGYFSKDVAPEVDWNALPLGFPRSGDFVALREAYLAPYETEEGAEFLVCFGLVDSGYRAEEVFQFCRAMNADPANAGRPLWPSKGFDELRGGQEVLQRKVDTYPGTSKPIPGGLMRVDVSTNRLKDALALVLAEVTPGDPGSWLLHQETGADYVQHYRSEAKDPADQTWKQRGSQPNHWWDCGVLQLAAARVLELHGVFRRLLEALARAAEPPPPPPPPPKPQRGGLW